MYDSLGITLAEHTDRESRSKLREEIRTDENIQGVRENTNMQSTTHSESTENELQTITFTNILAGKMYRVSVSDLSWFSTGSYIEIGYTYDGEFTQIVKIDTLPEHSYFKITIPEDSNAESLQVRIYGISKTSVYLENITDSESSVHYNEEQELEDNQKQQARQNISAMIDLLDSGVTLTDEEKNTILSKLGLGNLSSTLQSIEETLQDHEERISALEE